MGQANRGVYMANVHWRAALAASTLLLVLSACAENASTPVPVSALPPEQKSSLKIAEITDEAAPGVAVANFDLERLLDRIKAEVAATHPEILAKTAPESDPPGTKIKVVITQYDEGSRFARAMLIGLGQIHLEGDVVFVGVNSGQEFARYKVSKDFAFGGLYGGLTGMEDVEKGFAKSVAEILTEKQ